MNNASYYTTYVRHCLRFYARYEHLETFNSEADKQNWKACNKAVKKFNDNDRELLLTLYQSKGDFSEIVSDTSRLEDMNIEELWRMIRKLERAVATLRGLI